jgi:ankyrin repeat protein
MQDLNLYLIPVQTNIMFHQNKRLFQITYKCIPKRLVIFSVLVAAGLFIQKANAQTPALFDAVKNNNIKEVKLLLDKGADPNAIDDDSDNVLINATLFASKECMKVLLEKKASTNFKNKFGQTALMCCTHDLDKLKLLLQYGADINAKANSGNTTLLIACVGKNQYEVVKFLLDKGADPLARNERQETSLMRAAQFGDTATTHLLLSKAVDINAGDKYNGTALSNALLNANTAVAFDLLNKGADPNLVDSFKTIGLSYALLGSNPEIVKAVLAKTTDVNVPDIGGMTPLMWAVYNEHDNTEIIQALLDKGAAVNVKAKDDTTPLSWAKKKGNTATVALLQKAGAQ